MLNWGKKKKKEAGATEPDEEVNWAELRRPVLWCAGCRSQRAPFVYMENGNDYCIPCARELFVRLHVRPAGQRDEDIKEIPFD